MVPLLSVTHGQCDAGPSVTFTAFAGTKFILLGDSWRHFMYAPRIYSCGGT